MTTATAERPAPAESAPAATTMCEQFQASAERYADEIALRNADGSVELTWTEYADRVRRIAAGLAALGVGRGDTVGLLMSNRPEFHLCDTAAIHLGATPFSIYNTLAPDQIAHLFENAGNRVVIGEVAALERLEAAGAIARSRARSSASTARPTARSRSSRSRPAATRSSTSRAPGGRSSPATSSR